MAVGGNFWNYSSDFQSMYLINFDDLLAILVTQMKEKQLLLINIGSISQISSGFIFLFSKKKN